MNETSEVELVVAPPPPTIVPTTATTKMKSRAIIVLPTLKTTITPQIIYMKENSTIGPAIERLENEQKDLRSKIFEVEKSQIKKEKINILMIFNMLKDIRNHSARILKVEQAVKRVSFFYFNYFVFKTNKLI